MRGIVEQIARGLRAFHRMEMLHQDLRPENVMIDKTGTVKIIDFGSTRVAGVAEAERPADRDRILGTAQYTAPEYFVGEGGTPRVRPVLARRHRLSDADGPAALRRAHGDGAHRAPSSAAAPMRRRSTTSARSRPGSTARCARRCIPIRTSATRSCRSSSTTCAIPTRAFCASRRTADRAQSAGVLEGAVVRPGCAVLALLACTSARLAKLIAGSAPLRGAHALLKQGRATEWRAPSKNEREEDRAPVRR